MKRVQFCALLLSLVLLPWICTVNADNNESPDNVESSLSQTILSLHSPQAALTFSGNVVNENGERYHYFFQIQRNYNRFHATATLVDAQNKTVLIYEESNSLIEQPEITHWQVGNVFLRFNPINNSWVFGVKNKKKGFNFKVDMLGLSNTSLSKQQDLRSGVELLISQTGHLNGHLQTDETNKEQFVTAKKTWFRQMWVSKPQLAKHPFTSILCEFNNGSAFYSVNLQEPDALRASVVGWRDEQGAPVSVSQFVSVQEEKVDGWIINIPAPKLTLSLENLLNKINENHQLVVGVIDGAMPGFCAISQDEIDEQQTEPRPSGSVHRI